MSAQSQPITKLELEECTSWKKIASGKVREIFEIDPSTLLFVATDRISTYDVIMNSGIPSKGALLTQISAHWFSLIKSRIPELRTHLISTDLPSDTPSDLVKVLDRRSMLVRRHDLLPLESIVRGYITGSAWSEYKKSGTVHGMQVPAGLQESQRFEGGAIWTPSTKAEQGEHDENISKAKAIEIVGEDIASKIERVSLEIYKMAHDYAAERGIIIADTKFEFGIDKSTNEIVLVDEVLTPDSSRFWPADKYEVGKSQDSYDKQYLRDWVTNSGNKHKENVSVPEEVVQETAKKYTEAYEKLTGKSWN